MRSPFSILRLGLIAMALAGCSKFGTRGNDEPLHATTPSGVSVYCSSLITQDQIEAIGAKVDASGIQGGNPQGCTTSARTRGVGFTQVVIVPNYKVNASSSWAQADANGGWVAEFPTSSDAVSPATLAQVQSVAAGVIRGRSFEVVTAQPTFSAVLLGDVAQVPHEVLANSVRFHVPASVSDAFGARLHDFDQGQATMVFYEGDNFTTGAIARGEAHAGETVRLAKFNSLTGSDYLNDLWSRIANTHGAITDTTLPFLWMDTARAWWPNLKLQPADGLKQWNAAWAQANSLWSQPGDRTDQVGATSSLKALRFLLTIDPSNSAAIYGMEADKIGAFLGSDDATVYAGLMDLVHAHVQDPQPVFDLAKNLATKSAPADAWKSAIALAGRVNGDPAKVKTVGEAQDWIQQVRPTDNATDEAVSWVADQGVDEARLNQLKSVYDYFSKNGFAAQAWDKSVDLVITKKLSPAQTETYTKLVGALATARRGDAIAKADDYVLVKNLNPQQAGAMASTIAWLTTVPGVADPVAKAEDYLLTQNINPDDVLRIQALYKWMITTSRNLVALNKAEDYVLVKKLTPDQTSAIQLAYDWLAYTPQGAQSFDKAEDYVLNQHLSLDQVGQLKSVGEWLANTPVGASGAVAKAEDYVLNRKLTNVQTDLLSTVYIWLRDAGVPSGQLFAKAEDYVLNKNLTAEQFSRLRAAFAKHKQAGEADPLGAAEKDVFNGGFFGGIFH